MGRSLCFLQQYCARFSSTGLEKVSPVGFLYGITGQRIPCLFGAILDEMGQQDDFYCDGLGALGVFAVKL
jgi:hypothetical protein